ncbi:MAG: (2Fe-2S)-binding protein [Deltaproteobacteria bacterium]|nr:(2Fe-2S)-binding protein [Deltaproteobacteria bacterium]
MPRVEFAHTDLTAEAPAGSRLLDVADETPGAALASACRHANCGLCQVLVLDGAALCDPPEAAERALLARLGAPPEVRLGCQVTLRDGPGALRVWPAALPRRG